MNLKIGYPRMEILDLRKQWI